MYNVKKFLISFSVLIGAFALAVMPQAFAQDADEDVDEMIMEEVTVTGSRIKRDVFSTTTPIQILDTESAQKLGIVSITELLQKATAASGEQIDGGISTNAGQTNASEAPPDGGVGSACINLRGLGCERTLVLLNDKRLGVTGIRGAPPQPDINMIPIGMVEGVDLLTGGLSTVYGADAVAGVVNVRLKKDFEGFNFTASTEQPDQKGGESNSASLVGGISSDNGNITFGMEWSNQKRVKTGDRSFSSCLRRGTSGISQTEDGTRILNCRSDFLANWMIVPGAIELFENGELILNDPDETQFVGIDDELLIYTPGTSNMTWGPNGLFPGEPVTGFSTMSAIPQPSSFSDTLADFPNDGRPFYLDRFRYGHDGFYNDQFDRREADLWRPYERFSLILNGHIDMGGSHNEELYIEAYYFNRTNFIIAATEQIFPAMLGRAPLVDDANNILLFDPVTGIETTLELGGVPVLADNPMNPFSVDVNPVITLDDNKQTFDTELQQVRLVGGIKGDLPFGDDNWSYDVAVSYDRGTGFVSQPVIIENNLFFATQNIGVIAATNADGQFINVGTDQVTCDPRFASLVGGFITAPTCVPLDYFADSIPGTPTTTSGSFGTQAERDYLIGNRTNRTVTELFNFEAYLTGDLFTLWNGEDVGSAFGIQYRYDTIDSQNSALGVLGLNAAENPLQEGETRGDRTTLDFYGEISAPLIVDSEMLDLLQLDLAVRATDDENFGSETVYQIGLLARFNEYFSVSTSFNTSFRAPNLREQFLADQAGALPGGADPCHSRAIALATPGPALDRLIANCVLSGADVNRLGLFGTVAIPTSTGGAAGLEPETSDSFTFTVSASQWWTDRYDFDIALTWFDIEIEDTVRALDPNSIVNRCYNDQPNLASPFCNRVFRDRAQASPGGNFISFVRAGFVNTGVETATGIDFTTRFGASFGKADVTWSTATTWMDERLSQEFPPTEADADGSAIVNDVGRIGNPEWTFQSTFGLAWGDFDLVWQSRYWSDTEFPEGRANPVILDTDGNCLRGSGCPLGADPEDFFGDDGFTRYQFNTTTQLRDSIGPVRPVTAAEGQWHHDLGLSYNFEKSVVTIGVNNLTNEEPPLISQEAGPNRNNAVSSGRYDLIGRSYFLRFVTSF